MQITTLGKSGLKVSRLCFGTLTMSPLQTNMSPEEGARLLVYAYERGVRFLDTADLYGTYPHIRLALKDAPDYVISTKAYCYDRKTAQEALERAYRGVGRDYIDLFMLHEQESLYTLRGHEEALVFLSEQRDKGHIGAVGVSTHFAGCVRATTRFPMIQVVHPLINLAGIGIQDGTREDMEDAIRAARACGSGIFAMKPLGGGHLIGSNRAALEYAAQSPLLDSVAVGMQSIEEIDADVALDMVCPQDAIVDVGFGEHLQDLRVRTSVGSRCFAVTCTAGPARTQFIHWFRRLGCRYLQLFIHSRSATIHEAGVLPARYPVDERPQLHLDDPLHDRIAQVCRRTLLSCMHEHYEDCPWREQALYAFDSRSQMLAGYYAFGEFDFPRENLRLLALSQREDGLLELCAPARAPITIPAFSLSFIVALEEYCRYSGDLDFCREMLPVAERILDVLDRQTQNSLAWRMQEPQYWNFYEWSPGLDGESRTAVPPRAEAGLQLFGLVALQRMDSLRRMLGVPQRESEQALHQALVAGLEQFWDDDAQAYASVLCDGRRSHYAELIQALALLSGACPAERAVILRDGLLHGRWSPITLSHSLLKYEALLQDPALGKAVFDEIGRRWGAMLYQGATTFWEVDEGAPAFDRAGSLCHGWSAIPYYLYCAYGLGVRPERPGVWQLTDRRDGLSMSAALCTPEGCFDVRAGSVGPVTMQRR